jgi:hypothetical protein
MPTIEIDFETFKAITALRTSEQMSEGDVVKQLLIVDGQPDTSLPKVAYVSPEQRAPAKYWWHKGVEFPVGMKLEHVFRGDRSVTAEIVESGVLFDGKVYRDLSPAGVAAAGYQVNGWDFWNYKDNRGNWSSVKALRG